MTLFRDELGRVAVEVLDSLHPVSEVSALEPHDIDSELLAIHTDFEGLDWDHQRQTLSVVVGPVELEGTRLGRFEIILQCDRLAERRPYEVVTLTPNPASVDQQVTHPHVRSNLLCEGEGTPLIRLTLDQGRLYDFFELVARVLDSRVLAQRHSDALAKNKERLRHAFANFFDTSDDTIRSDLQFVKKRLGRGHYQAPGWLDAV